jgi:zinc and cadmium transporter
MSAPTWLVIYCVLILLASLLGGWIPLWINLTHKRMELAASFVSGVMLGVGLLHMLPHAVMARVQGDATTASAAIHDHEAVHDLLSPVLLWLVAGFLAMFLIERFFCFHHHDAPVIGGASGNCSPHDHVQPSHATRHHLRWVGAVIGLSIHSLIEGVALAASVEVGRSHIGEGGSLALGFATFIVIALHKPFDALTVSTLMGLSGRAGTLRHVVNIAFSLLIPLGVVLLHVGIIQTGEAGALVSGALAFSAGTFLCIAMSDLLPELQFHQHDRVKLSAALVSGLALAWLIAVLESRMHA